MDLREMKNKIIGRGVRRLQYESRLRRMLQKESYDIGIALGLSKQDSIMFTEIIEFKVFEELDKEVNVLKGYVLFSEN